MSHRQDSTPEARVRSPHDPDFSTPYKQMFGHNIHLAPAPGVEMNPDGPLLAQDQGGFVMTRDEAMKLFHRIIAGIDAVGDTAIAEHNAAADAEHRQNPRSRRYEAPPAPEPKPARAPRPGVVYLMTNGYLHKIGVSTDAERRARQVELASGLPVKVIAAKQVPDMLPYELELHRRYSAYRREGEWFELPDAILAELVSELGGAA